MAILDILAVMSAPQLDEDILRAVGIPLDRALFPLLISIERFGPIGVVELADRVGRDYTTVSRQVAKLDQLGLIDRQGSTQDRRVREAFITASGKELTDAVDAARARAAGQMFKAWEDRDVSELVRLTQKLAEGMKALTVSAPEDGGH